MASTYEPIATTTLGSAASNITFTSIPGTYTDLRIILSALKNSAVTNAQPGLIFNNDSNLNYSYTTLAGNGSSASSGTLTSNGELDLANGNLNNNFTELFIIDIFSYASSVYKMTLWTASQNLNGSGPVTAFAGSWRSTSAITTIKLYDIFGASGFGTGTSATLYGIKAA